MDSPAFGSWQELLDYYHRFLSGEIEKVPTHCGPLEEESGVILEELLAINRLGVLTVDSQPGAWETHEKKEISHNYESAEATDVEFLQRAYLDCYMPERLFTLLASRLAKSELLVFGQLCDFFYELRPTVPVTIASYTFGGDHYEVSETWFPVGYNEGELEDILLETPEEVQEKIRERLYSVRLLDPIWGRSKHLFTEVVKGLK